MKGKAQPRRIEPEPPPEPAGCQVLAFATKGSKSSDEARLVELLADHDFHLYPFDRRHKASNVLRILRAIRRVRPALVVMEGTGTAGGVALLIARLLFGVRFVVSSGDAVGPFLAGAHRGIALPAWIYELLLCRGSAGFIGWTPYLVGRALTLGAPRGVTAPGFTLHPELPLTRWQVREELGVPQDALVLGIVGSLDWNDRKGYCYGLELVQALLRVERDDAVALIVGDGDGLPRLQELASENLGRRVFLPGAVPPEMVTSYLAAMDVGSLPQSLDQVGSLRYTTKISEYVTAGLPLITGRLPLAYDLAEGWSWRLPGEAPWSDEYVTALAGLVEHLTHEEVRERREAMPNALPTFNQAQQRRRVAAFIADVLEDLSSSQSGGSRHPAR